MENLKAHKRKDCKTTMLLMRVPQLANVAAHRENTSIIFKARLDPAQCAQADTLKTLQPDTLYLGTIVTTRLSCCVVLGLAGGFNPPCSVLGPARVLMHGWKVSCESWVPRNERSIRQIYGGHIDAEDLRDDPCQVCISGFLAVPEASTHLSGQGARETNNRLRAQSSASQVCTSWIIS